MNTCNRLLVQISTKICYSKWNLLTIICEIYQYGCLKKCITETCKFINCHNILRYVFKWFSSCIMNIHCTSMLTGWGITSDVHQSLGNRENSTAGGW